MNKNTQRVKDLLLLFMTDIYDFESLKELFGKEVSKYQKKNLRKHLIGDRQRKLSSLVCRHAGSQRLEIFSQYSLVLGTAIVRRFFIKLLTLSLFYRKCFILYLPIKFTKIDWYCLGILNIVINTSTHHR